MEKVVIVHQKPMPPRKIYCKAEDLFNKEFGWPEELLRGPKEPIEFQFNYRTSFDENLKSLKKRFNLTEKEVENLKHHFGLGFLVHSLEKNGYDKKILNKVYGKVFLENDADFFGKSAQSLIKKAKELDENYDHEDRTGQRIIVNLLLGIAFEYACKALILRKKFCINENKHDKNKLLHQKNANDAVKSRTISLDLAWDFIILDDTLMKFTSDEKAIGNYLLFCRNVNSHTPVLPASRGNYEGKGIKLITRILGAAQKTDWDKLVFEKMIEKM